MPKNRGKTFSSAQCKAPSAPGWVRPREGKAPSAPIAGLRVSLDSAWAEPRPPGNQGASGSIIQTGTTLKQTRKIPPRLTPKPSIAHCTRRSEKQKARSISLFHVVTGPACKWHGHGGSAIRPMCLFSFAPMPNRPSCLAKADSIISAVSTSENGWPDCLGLAVLVAGVGSSTVLSKRSVVVAALNGVESHYSAVMEGTV